MAIGKTRKTCTVLLAGPDPPPDTLGPCKSIWVPLLDAKVVKGVSILLNKIIENYDTVVFTSPRSPRFLAYDADQYNVKLQLLEKLKNTTIWAIGPKTAREIYSFFQIEPKVPEKFNSIELANALQLTGAKRVLAVRRPGGSPELSYILAESNILYTEIHAYTVTQDPNWHNKIPLEKIDYIVATSRQIADAIASLPRNLLPPIVSIGEPTTKKLLSYGIKPACTSKISTLDGIATCLKTTKTALS